MQLVYSRPFLSTRPSKFLYMSERRNVGSLVYTMQRDDSLYIYIILPTSMISSTTVFFCRNLQTLPTRYRLHVPHFAVNERISFCRHYRYRNCREYTTRLKLNLWCRIQCDSIVVTCLLSLLDRM